MNEQALYDDFSDWSRMTFGADADVGPGAPLNHLAIEVQEAIAAQDDVTEYADCLMLIWDAARRAGFDRRALLDAVERKLAVNKTRRWIVTPGDAPNEHAR